MHQVAPGPIATPRTVCSGQGGMLSCLHTLSWRAPLFSGKCLPPPPPPQPPLFPCPAQRTLQPPSQTCRPRLHRHLRKQGNRLRHLTTLLAAVCEDAKPVNVLRTQYQLVVNLLLQCQAHLAPIFVSSSLSWSALCPYGSRAFQHRQNAHMSHADGQRHRPPP